uniref:TGF-beta propeptide domain-containing protein n=1 Tax=Labrus bergylta TaxID=56723 RepID=A0A3Q3G7V0_9LABR
LSCSASVMKSFPVLLLLLLLSPRTEGLKTRDQNSSHVTDVDLVVDVSSAVRRVDLRFLSVTIDASLASEEKFMYLLGSPKIRTLARALTPSFLRFGGTRQDFMVFTPQKSHEQGSGVTAGKLPPWLEERLKNEWTQQQVLLMKEDLRRKYRRVKFTGTSFALVANKMCYCAM